MILEQTYEVVVAVTQRGQPPQLEYDLGTRRTVSSVRGDNVVTYCKSYLAIPTENRMYHIPARSRSQALEKGKKYGRPLSARKLQFDKVQSDIEHLKLDQKPYGSDNVFQNALAMDEMIWQKKAKRAERIAENINEKGD